MYKASPYFLYKSDCILYRNYYCFLFLKLGNKENIHTNDNLILNTIKYYLNLRYI